MMVPRGYHPAGAAHGYDLYYLNVMAGPRRQWIFRNDPAHDWIMQEVTEASSGGKRSPLIAAMIDAAVAAGEGLREDFREHQRTLQINA